VEAERFVILLVDDDEVDVLMFRRAFAKAGFAYPLVIARRGQQALDYLAGTGEYGDRAKHPLPSYVLLDLKLPRVSGLDILSWMRQTEGMRTLPVSILSGSAEGGDIEKSKKLGIESYLVKPTAFPELLDLVKELGRRWEELRHALTK
jgi:CheY-like chemotaxis protein